MNYREHLRLPSALRYIDMLVAEIDSNPSDFEHVFSLVFDADMNIAWRAAWACQKISEKHPEYFSEQHFLRFSDLIIVNSHGGLRRGVLSVLNNITFPSCIPVSLINACFEWMVTPRSPIAVQALSMKILARVCEQEPDFIPELKAYLDNLDLDSYSKGFKSTRKNVLKRFF